MRILTITPMFPPDRAGIAIQAAMLVEGLREAGHEVRVITYSPRDAQEGEPAPDVVTIDRSARHRRLSPLLWWRVRREVAEADVIHVHGYSTLNLHAWLARCGRPVIFTYHGSEVWNYSPAKGGKLFRRLSKAAEIVCVSQALADALREKTDVVSEVIEPSLAVCYIEKARAATPPERAAHPVVLAVKGLYPVAGHEALVRAMAPVCERFPNAELWIAGAGPLQGELESVANDLGISANVKLLGLVDNRELIGTYGKAWVFANAATLESYGNVSVEALACGVPVVATKTAGAKALAEEFPEDIQLVPQDDPQALATALLERLELPTEVTAAARTRVAEEKSANAMVQNYVAFYEAASCRPMGLTFSYFSLTPGSGIPNVCVNLANAASTFDDVRASLITLVFEDHEVLPDVAVQCVTKNPKGAHRIFTSRWLRPVANRLYQRALVKLAPDWVVVNYVPLDAYAMRARQKLGHRVAYYYHNVTDPTLYEGVERTRREEEEAAMLATLREVDAIFTNSEFTKARVAETTGRDATVAYPAADLDVFRPDSSIKSEVPALVFVGRLVRHKGPDLLLEAFAQVRERHPETQLRLVGRGDESDYYRRLTERAREIGNVEIVGDLSLRELAGEYQRAWVFTGASRFEGFGMPFLEAHACGLPCVGLDVCSVPEVVANGETGLLVPREDVDGFAHAIGDLLTDGEKRERMAAAAVQRAQRFGWRKSAEIICRTLRSLS